MKIAVINQLLDNGIYFVTFKYWKEGDCACTAKKKTSSFSKEPTINEIINSI